MTIRKHITTELTQCIFFGKKFFKKNPTDMTHNSTLKYKPFTVSVPSAFASPNLFSAKQV
jgi:hypothetical protein